ncbi:MAG: ATP-binding protein, partial [Gammaproteobacteria bacterium]|nr:ATP-binding protein [Gammaproteobacteria bacterium]
EMMAHWPAPARRNPPQIFEFSAVNGSPIFVEITASSFVDRSGQLGAMIILQDVSSRIRAEQQRAHAEEEVRKREGQLRLITDVVPVLISYIDSDGIYRFNNRTHTEWYGRPLDQITGHLVRDVLHPSDYQQLSVHLDQAFQGRFVEYEMPLTCVESAVCHVHGNLVPDVADGVVRGVVNVVTNITESRKAEEREKQHMLELAHVGRVVTLGELSSHLAHELAQPLTAIANFADASMRMLDGKACSVDEVRESLADIVEQSDRARKIVAQLRNFIRKNELQESEENINDLVADVVRLERLEARWHDMELNLALSDSLPLVDVDRTLMQQVLLNLIHNGIEAMQDVSEGGSLSIETRHSAGSVSVLVSDTGPGLAENTDRVFEPFFTTKGSGMGMGLAIAKSIIEAHGGSLKGKNNDAGGATFCFTLSARGASV